MKESIIGRTAEKVELQKLYESGKAEFVAIYGCQGRIDLVVKTPKYCYVMEF